MSENKKEVLEKEKIYHEKRKTRMPIYIVICVLLVYVFFFTSKITIPQPITNETNVTILGKEEEFANNRSVTLVSAEYSREQELIELVLSLKNDNYDNVNNYYYALTAVNERSSKIKIKEVFNEELFTVIRLYNVKKNYREIEFLLAPKIGEISDVTDDITANIILNKYNVTSVNKIKTDKTKMDYLQDRLIGIVSQLEEKLHRQEENLEKLQIQKSSLEEEIINSEKEQKYMTEKEIQEAADRNQSNQDLIDETIMTIEKQKKKIEKTQAEIKDAKEKADALK